MKLKFNNISAGSECLFIPLNKNRALKIYRNKKLRDNAFKAQKIAYKSKIGPKVFSRWSTRNKTQINDINALYPTICGNIIYGFITQIAKIKIISDKQFYNLKDKMLKLKFKTSDINIFHNVGLIDKKVVCIDFGELSIGKQNAHNKITR